MFMPASLAETMISVAHLTSVHSRYDSRIFLKECRSLAGYGMRVTLVVADGRGDETVDGVLIRDVGRPLGRWDRMKGATRKILSCARGLDADIYHLHDPELIPVGLLLKISGKTVIFDAHEDLPKQLLSKPYLGKWTQRFLSTACKWFEWATVRWLDGIVAATPSIGLKFAKLNSTVEIVNNYPLLGELSSDEIDWTRKAAQVCYVGGISSIRGVRQVVQAMENVNVDTRLALVGKFSEPCLERKIRSMNGWQKVDELGFLGRAEVRDVLACSVAGLVTFLPAPNHMDAQPNKMFEYMSAGVPVIASGFPLWREIIEANDCGICVDPQSPEGIATAINKLIEDPSLAERMGRNGQYAVSHHYNWGVEEKKLINIYKSLSVETEK